MAVTLSDVLFVLSVGYSGNNNNTDPAYSTGSVMSGQYLSYSAGQRPSGAQLVNWETLFPRVDTTEATAGSSRHRMVYVLNSLYAGNNASGSSAYETQVGKFGFGAALWFENVSPGLTMSLSLTGSLIASDTTNPVGSSWVTPTSVSTALRIPRLNPVGSDWGYQQLWIRRTIAPGFSATPGRYTLRMQYITPPFA